MPITQRGDSKPARREEHTVCPQSFSPPGVDVLSVQKGTRSRDPAQPASFDLSKRPLMSNVLPAGSRVGYTRRSPYNGGMQRDRGWSGMVR